MPLSTGRIFTRRFPQISFCTSPIVSLCAGWIHESTYVWLSAAHPCCGDIHLRLEPLFSWNSNTSHATRFFRVGSSFFSAFHSCSRFRPTVVFSGMLAGREVLSIDCSGIHSTFEPATSSLHIGEAVQRGQRIGEVVPPKQEDSHMRKGDLHWGAKVSRYRYINPLRMLQGHPRLKTLQ